MTIIIDKDNLDSEVLWDYCIWLSLFSETPAISLKT